MRGPNGQRARGPPRAMTAPRTFCRFAASPAAPEQGRYEVPPDGLCLSAFVVVRSAEHPSRVLLGHVNPAADWGQLGALDPERIAAWKDRWMLPSSHLIQLEGPAEAARRIVRELTGLTIPALDGPLVTSEVYPPRRHPNRGEHWDLEFIFTAAASEADLRPHPAWTELRFVETRGLDPATMARSHEDILAYVGLPTGG